MLCMHQNCALEHLAYWSILNRCLRREVLHTCSLWFKRSWKDPPLHSQFQVFILPSLRTRWCNKPGRVGTLSSAGHVAHQGKMHQRTLQLGDEKEKELRCALQSQTMRCWRVDWCYFFQSCIFGRCHAGKNDSQPEPSGLSIFLMDWCVIFGCCCCCCWLLWILSQEIFKL